METMTESEFFKTFEGCIQYGLSKEDASAIVSKGKAWADYFEMVNMACFYEDYIKSGLPIDVWAISCPSVILDKYKDRAQNKEAFELAMGV